MNNKIEIKVINVSDGVFGIIKDNKVLFSGTEMCSEDVVGLLRNLGFKVIVASLK